MNADHVLTLFAEANPVPDVDVLRRDLGPSTADLTTLELRSGIMRTEQLERAATPSSTEPRRPRPAWVFALALVVTLVAIGGVVWLMRGGEEQDMVDQPTTTAAPSTTEAPVTTTEGPASTTSVATTEAAPPTTATVPAEASLSEGWELAAGGSEVPTSAAGYVDGIGFVAVGGREAPVSKVAVSQEGIEWIFGDASVMSDDAAFLVGVVPGGPGVLAYGWTCEGECGGLLPQEPALYGSADGLSWVRLEHEAFIGCGTRGAECFSGISSIAVATDGSLLATGRDAGSDGTQTSVAWTSVDGIDWTRTEVDLAEMVPTGWSLFSEGIEHPVHTGERWIGFLWAYYFPPDADFEVGQTIVVASDDGSAWTAVDTGDVFADAMVWDAVATPEGIVAVDMQRVWTSPDGLVWERGAMPGSADYRFLVSLDVGVAAVGDAWEVPGATLAFTSDGSSWQMFEGVAGLGDAIVNYAGSSSERIVLGGYRHVEGELFTDDAVFEPAIWGWGG